MTNSENLVKEWPPTIVDELETGTWLGRHRLRERLLPAADSLAKLIQTHPRDETHVHSMSGDSADPEYVDIDVGTLSGDEVLAAIERGRVWLSLVNLQDHNEEIAKALDDLYGELADRCNGFVPQKLVANLLVSSPGAEVFYHADAYPGFLWQLQGTKRVIVYPAWDDRYLSPENRELCLSGQLVDDIYEPKFDADAMSVDFEPGQFIGWPQSTPHRVVNLSGLNVSFATEHYTKTAARRRTVATANWWFRKHLGIDSRGIEIHGFQPFFKRTAFVLVRKSAALLGRRLLVPVDPDISPSCRLDPADPRGYSEI